MVRFMKWWGRGDQAPTPLMKAISILGRDCVVSGIQAAYALKLTATESMVPYSVKTLKAAARENRRKKRQWHLFAVFDLSLRTLCEQGLLIGTTQIARDIIAATAAATDITFEPRYVLVDLRPRLVRGERSWHRQELYLKRFPKLLRVRANLLTQIVFLAHHICKKEVLKSANHLAELKLFPGLRDDEDSLDLCPLRVGQSVAGVSDLTCIAMSQHFKIRACMIVIRKPD